jgi:hypothetical protein
MERRKDTRLTTYAKVVELQNKTVGYLHDINRFGFKIGFLEETGFKENDEIEITVIPEEESGLPSFNVHVIIKWKEWDNVFYHAGCEISGITKQDKEKLKNLEIYFDSIENDSK